MKIHWDCNNPKCMADCITEVEDLYISEDEKWIMCYVGKCTKCGKFRYTNGFFKISNQVVTVN